ncbi:unnamed protein product [Meloidogyne enterolobii]|uniref:Uncharacterized protein n=1 Tax=Meloidogyne enterolobii TaxID=390850 RepID=A0ACB1B017_MELEN
MFHLLIMNIFGILLLNKHHNKKFMIDPYSVNNLLFTINIYL